MFQKLVIKMECFKVSAEHPRTGNRLSYLVAREDWGKAADLLEASGYSLNFKKEPCIATNAGLSGLF